MTSPSFRAIGATTYLCPIPAVLVSCAAAPGEKPNVLTIAWAGVVNSSPPMVSISVQPKRFSHDLILQSGEFVVNMVSRAQGEAVDLCGVKSGRDTDKFALCGFTAIPAPKMRCAPAIAECPAHIACRVVRSLSLGSHTMFLSEVVETCVQERCFREDGHIAQGDMDLVSYAHGEYFAQGEKIGFFGWSVASPDILARRMGER